MLESFFGPRLPLDAQYLNHLANREEASSPVDSGLLAKSYLVNRHPLTNVISSMLGGVGAFFSLLLCTEVAYLSMNERFVRSFFPKNKEDLCGGCNESAQKIVDSALKICKFLDRNGFYKPEECKEYLENSPIKNTLFQNLFDWGMTKSSGYAMELACYRAIENQEKEQLLTCQKITSLAEILNCTEAFAFPVFISAIVYSVYSFANAESKKPFIEQQIISKLKERYHMAAEKLLDEHEISKGNVLLQGEVKAKAAFILKNKEKMFRDIERLNLPSLLVYENKHAIIQSVIDACYKVLGK